MQEQEPATIVTFVGKSRGRSRRKQPERLEPYPAGSPEAIRIVRSFIAQKQRLAAGRDELSRALRNRGRPDRRRVV